MALGRYIHDSNKGSPFLGFHGPTSGILQVVQPSIDTLRCYLVNGQVEKLAEVKPDQVLIAYDTANILFSAMKRTKDPSNADQIRDELKKLRDVPLVTDESFSFGPENTPIKDVIIYKIDKSGVHYEATLR